MNILSKIVAVKKQEIELLYRQYNLADLQAQCAQKPRPSTPLFYVSLADARQRGESFFISEFKRKSPSEGWINQHADLPAQLRAYAKAGARAISVLTDTAFFGGSYADLALAADTLGALQPGRPLLLQKDFVLDPIQIYLARLHGADLILLIAAILEPEVLQHLKNTAESLGMGVLVEVHDREELEKIDHLDFPVLGVNNRDLKTFRTSLNRVNVLKQDQQRYIISESGVRDAVDFQLVGQADGFLIGTGLMRRSEALQNEQHDTFAAFFQTTGKYLFKACGIRTPEMLMTAGPDWLGINFSPVSKRRPTPAMLEKLKDMSSFPAHWAALFYKNSEADICETLQTYPFQTVQLYAGDATPDFVRSLKQRVLLAVSIRNQEDLAQINDYAADVDCFILDGAVPGSGQTIETAIPADFPYPFLLAGGIHAGNLDRVLAIEHCIGVDVASGIETEGQVDAEKIQEISMLMERLKRI
ncbi:MAG: bifunctional indole-3-glycerol phosphate synthase/phosphoribosylanthranilate isomerase [Saprospiraceae bacterium]|nr:bifunctional indole-3-glycerol phosphate synthase/phosphoribosylanthranilate isomerase [Saprospiraceae bacterium]